MKTILSNGAITEVHVKKDLVVTIYCCTKLFFLSLYFLSKNRKCAFCNLSCKLQSLNGGTQNEILMIFFLNTKAKFAYKKQLNILLEFLNQFIGNARETKLILGPIL